MWNKKNSFSVLPETWRKVFAFISSDSTTAGTFVLLLVRPDTIGEKLKLIEPITYTYIYYFMHPSNQLENSLPASTSLPGSSVSEIFLLPLLFALCHRPKKTNRYADASLQLKTNSTNLMTLLSSLHVLYSINGICQMLTCSCSFTHQD